MSTPENIRYHAAGHLAAAVLLAKAAKASAASLLLKEVAVYMNRERVDCPPPLIAVIEEYAEDPLNHIADISAVEALFVHDANKAFEDAGIRIGSGK